MDNLLKSRSHKAKSRWIHKKWRRWPHYHRKPQWRIRYIDNTICRVLWFSLSLSLSADWSPFRRCLTFMWSLPILLSFVLPGLLVFFSRERLLTIVCSYHLLIQFASYLKKTKRVSRLTNPAQPNLGMCTKDIFMSLVISLCSSNRLRTLQGASSLPKAFPIAAIYPQLGGTIEDDSRTNPCDHSLLLCIIYASDIRCPGGTPLNA